MTWCTLNPLRKSGQRVSFSRRLVACSNSGILLRWFECLVSGCVVILGTDEAVGYVEGVTVVLPGRKYAIEEQGLRSSLFLDH